LLLREQALALLPEQAALLPEAEPEALLPTKVLVLLREQVLDLLPQQALALLLPGGSTTSSASGAASG
jgi:hypothetical protein